MWHSDGNALSTAAAGVFAQVSAARVVIDHTVQQVTGHQGANDKPQARELGWWLRSCEYG